MRTTATFITFLSHRFTATVQEQENVSSFISPLICSTVFLNFLSLKKKQQYLTVPHYNSYLFS
jgi:hypothetical protein